MTSDIKKCIYCHESNPFDESHIIPECLGSNLILKDSVCITCNNKISKCEAKICEDFSLIRALLEIKCKGKYATTNVELNAFGQTKKIRMRGFKTLGFIPPIIEEDEQNRYFRIIADSPEMIKKQMRQFYKKGICFKEENISPKEVKAIFKNELNNITSMDFRRTAAKIAFEAFCRWRPQQSYDTELSQIRDFIKTGNESSRQIVFLIYQERLLNYLLNLPFPLHIIFIFGSENYKMVASIVTIFGLFTYFIILKQYDPYILKDWDNFSYTNPVDKKTREPIYSSIPKINLIIQLVQKSQKDEKAMEDAKNYARAKFDSFFRKHILGDRNTKKNDK